MVEHYKDAHNREDSSSVIFGQVVKGGSHLEDSSSKGCCRVYWRAVVGERWVKVLGEKGR